MRFPERGSICELSHLGAANPAATWNTFRNCQIKMLRQEGHILTVWYHCKIHTMITTMRCELNANQRVIGLLQEWHFPVFMMLSLAGLNCKVTFEMLQNWSFDSNSKSLKVLHLTGKHDQHSDISCPCQEFKYLSVAMISSVQDKCRERGIFRLNVI